MTEPTARDRADFLFHQLETASLEIHDAEGDDAGLDHERLLGLIDDAAEHWKGFGGIVGQAFWRATRQLVAERRPPTRPRWPDPVALDGRAYAAIGIGLVRDGLDTLAAWRTTDLDRAVELAAAETQGPLGYGHRDLALADVEVWLAILRFLAAARRRAEEEAGA